MGFLISKPKKPLVRAGLSAIRESVWAQIPLGGTLILGLEPIPKDDFEKIYHVKATEIPELVDFIKDTGKLQIVLNLTPSFYAGLDYLELVFDELKPPYDGGFPVQAFLTPEEQKEYYIEYITIGNVAYFNFLRKFLSRLGYPPTPPGLLLEVLTSGFRTYAYLKALHYNDLVAEWQDRMIEDPASALHLEYLYKYYIADPFSDSVCKLVNHSFRGLREMQELPLYRRMDWKKIRVPVEIGQFLMKDKLAHYPESLDACKELIAHYENTDLIEMATALNQGISDADPDLVTTSKDDLCQILDELWETKSLKRRIKGLRYGVPISIAAIGPIAAAAIGGIEGFLIRTGVLSW